MSNPLGRALRHRRAGHHTLAWAAPLLRAPENFSLTSPAFRDGASLPELHRGRLFAPNISPALNWTVPPPGTIELVLLVQDPDVPSRKPATHALTVGIDPHLGGLPQDALRNPSPLSGIEHGRGALGRRGWVGPAPVPSHGPHSYVFQLFALDVELTLAKVTLDAAMAAMAGHVMGRARLVGTYEIA